MNLMNLFMLGVPWLADKLGLKKTYIFSVLLAGACVYGVWAGFGPWLNTLIAYLGANTFISMRMGVAKVEPYVLMLDTLLERFGYADLDKNWEELKKALDAASPPASKQ